MSKNTVQETEKELNLEVFRADKEEYLIAGSQEAIQKILLLVLKDEAPDLSEFEIDDCEDFNI